MRLPSSPRAWTGPISGRETEVVKAGYGQHRTRLTTVGFGDSLGAGERLQPLHDEAVMNGRGDEIIDLARVNLVR
jgi:hypothetical protein